MSIFQADNPLGRTVVRSDIYRMAERARMLCIPGSEVEDRQYQLDIKGFTVNTSTWHELDHCLRYSFISCICFLCSISLYQ
jgi:hypothetical protein